MSFNHAPRRPLFCSGLRAAHQPPMIDTDEYPVRCLMYSDLNRVRAGVVAHPKQWAHGRCHEIMTPPDRYRLLDRKMLLALLRLNDHEARCEASGGWLNKSLEAESNKRDGNWTNITAVGGEAFLKEIKVKLAAKVVGRRIEGKEYASVPVLHESSAAHSADFGHEMGSLTPKNTLLWRIYDVTSTT